MAEIPRPRVIVAHPGTQHSHYLAVGVQRAGLLEAYITQLYYDPHRWPFVLVQALPMAYRQRVDQFLYLRHHPELNRSKVITINTYAELLFILMNRLRIASRFRQNWMLDAEKRFSQRVGEIASQRADILIGTDDASRDAFRIAKKHGLICILDMSIGHRLTGKRIAEEEQTLQPAFAASMADMTPREEDIRYGSEEVELADYFLIGSSFARQSLIENGANPDRIFVVPYGADMDLYHPASESNHPSGNKLRVLFAGYATQRKGISYLLDAIHQLKPHYDISLTICGAIHPAIERCERYTGLYEALGHVEYPRMPEVYRQADVLVLPSLFEGYGRVIIEAMASGLPVIGTPNTGAPDAISEGVEGFIVPIRDVEAIKQRLIYLYENPEKRREMGLAARRKAVENYSWEHYYHNIGRVINTIWEEHQR